MNRIEVLSLFVPMENCKGIVKLKFPNNIKPYSGMILVDDNQNKYKIEGIVMTIDSNPVNTFDCLLNEVRSMFNLTYLFLE